MPGSETDGEFGDTADWNGELQSMPESRFPCKSSGLYKGQAAVWWGMAQAELREDSRTEISGETKDRTRGTGRGFCDYRLGMTCSCRTGMMGVVSEMNQQLGHRQLWAEVCGEGTLGSFALWQRVIKCTSNSEKLVPFRQTRLFIYLSPIIIRMLTNLPEPCSWLSRNRYSPSLLSHAEFTASEVITKKKI